MRLALSVLALLSPLLLASCGGGGSAGPVTVVLPSEGRLEGTIEADASTVFVEDLVVGDRSNQPVAAGIRVCFSFDVSGIPVGATVQKATLRVVQRLVVGAPYATLGGILVDEVVFGDTLDLGAYDRSYPLNQGLGPISADDTLEPRTLDVTAAVQDAIQASRSHAQFRLRFAVETNSDAVSDQTHFWSTFAATTPDDAPTLQVTYQR